MERSHKASGGTSVIDRYIRKMFPGGHKLVAWHSTSVVIIKPRNMSDSSLEASSRKKEPDLNMSAPGTVYKEVLIAPFTQLVVHVSTSIHGLLNITPICAEDKASKTGIVVDMASLTLYHNAFFRLRLKLQSISDKPPKNEKELRLDREHPSTLFTRSLMTHVEWMTLHAT